MESSPMALVLASQEDVLSHGHVLYGLVKAGQNGDSVESTSRMVNVVPRKRIYCMESVDELQEFRHELLKRPLVLQPVIQAGTGIQSLDCFFCVKKESWVVMVNQFHPKIMDTINAGMDMAKRCMFRGESFILEFAFGDILKKQYYGNIKKYMPSKYAYTDCEYGDVTIRSNKASGDKVTQFRFTFDHVSAEEVKVRTLQEAAKERRSPVLEFIPQSELKEMLPNWVFDEVEVEDSIVSTSDYHSDTNSGATGGSIITSQPRVLGRTQRSHDTNRYEVPVELHVPNDVCDVGYEQDDRLNDFECAEYKVGRYRHFHQGSGRSDTDSGFGDVGYHDKSALRNCQPVTKYNDIYSSKGNQYDNYAFHYDIDSEPYRDRDCDEPEVDTIITRTGKKTFMSLDSESRSARMIDDSAL